MCLTREVAAQMSLSFETCRTSSATKRVVAMTCSYRKTGIWILVALGFGTSGFQSAYADEMPTEHLETFETIPGLQYGMDFDLYVGSKMSELKDERIVLEVGGEVSEIPLLGRTVNSTCGSNEPVSFQLLPPLPTEKAAPRPVPPMPAPPVPAPPKPRRTPPTEHCSYYLLIHWDFFAKATATTISFKLLDHAGRPQPVKYFHLTQVTESSSSTHIFPTIPGHDYWLNVNMSRGPGQPSENLIVDVAGRTLEFPLSETRLYSPPVGGAEPAVPTAVNIFPRIRFTAVAPSTSVSFSFEREGRRYAADNVDWGVDEQAAYYERALTRIIGNKPTRIWIHLDQLSTMVDEPLDLEVFLATRFSVNVTADKDYDIQFRSDGEISPSKVTIHKGERSAKAKVVSNKAGPVTIQATSTTNPLQPATAKGTICGPSTPIQVLLFPQQLRAPADNRTPDLFELSLVDGTNTPVSDGKPKTVGVTRNGVGAFVARANQIPAGQCTIEGSIVSGEPGDTTVAVGIASMPKPQTAVFTFYQAISCLLIVLSLTGGVAGGFVKAVSVFSESRGWGLWRWIAELVVSALTGLCLSLSYYLGLLPHSTGLPGGLPAAFVLGMCGGFGGAWVMEKLLQPHLPNVGPLAGQVDQQRNHRLNERPGEH